jgi:hypothetical protein
VKAIPGSISASISNVVIDIAPIGTYPVRTAAFLFAGRVAIGLCITSTPSAVTVADSRAFCQFPSNKRYTFRAVSIEASEFIFIDINVATDSFFSKGF